jgi:hypothetical protein
LRTVSNISQCPVGGRFGYEQFFDAVKGGLAWNIKIRDEFSILGSGANLMVVKGECLESERFEKSAERWNVAVTIDRKNRHARKIKWPQVSIQGLQFFGDGLERFGARGSRRKIYHLAETSHLPVFRLGAVLRRSVLLRWISGQESRVRGHHS